MGLGGDPNSLPGCQSLCREVCHTLSSIPTPSKALGGHSWHSEVSRIPVPTQHWGEAGTRSVLECGTSRRGWQQGAQYFCVQMVWMEL